MMIFFQESHLFYKLLIFVFKQLYFLVYLKVSNICFYINNTYFYICIYIFFLPGDTSTIISLQPALKFNGGGHLNHSIFWEVLSPHGGGEPEGKLMEAIVRDFGSFEKMKNNLVNSSVAVQGSGWCWLGYDVTAKQLKIVTCVNQDPLKATTG